MDGSPRFLEAGDRALVVEVGDSIEIEVNDRVRGLLTAIEDLGLEGVEDLVPSYRSLLIAFDPVLVTRHDLIEVVAETFGKLELAEQPEPRVVTLPTLYGGDHGPDLEHVATYAGMDPERVIELHSGVDYRVYMIGFAPGFPYLGGLPPELATPRLGTPRVRIPPGSVGIAESQTGVYPAASPGGWQLIGRTPVRLFDPQGDPPSIVVAGDFIRFSALESEDEYEEISALAKQGKYVPESTFPRESAARASTDGP